MIEKNVVALGLGSNATWNGMESLEILKKACEKLRPLFQNFALSSVYRTKPMYVENQADFLNLVLVGTILDKITPRILLEKIHEIERSLGRNRSLEIRNGPRSIDIDIEIFGNEKIHEIDLQIPHPRIFERAFVCVPLTEVSPKIAENFAFPVFPQKDVERVFPPFLI